MRAAEASANGDNDQAGDKLERAYSSAQASASGRGLDNEPPATRSSRWGLRGSNGGVSSNSTLKAAPQGRHVKSMSAERLETVRSGIPGFADEKSGGAHAQPDAQLDDGAPDFDGAMCTPSGHSGPSIVVMGAVQFSALAMHGGTLCACGGMYHTKRKPCRP